MRACVRYSCPVRVLFSSVIACAEKCALVSVWPFSVFCCGLFERISYAGAMWMRVLTTNVVFVDADGAEEAGEERESGGPEGEQEGKEGESLELPEGEMDANEEDGEEEDERAEAQEKEGDMEPEPMVCFDLFSCAPACLEPELLVCCLFAFVCFPVRLQAWRAVPWVPVSCGFLALTAWPRPQVPCESFDIV